MVLTYEPEDAARALDAQQVLDWRRGWQVIDPAGGSNLVTAGTGDFEFDAASGDINAGGTVVSAGAETVDLSTDANVPDADDSSLVVIYRDSSGTLQFTVGTLATRDPSGEDVRSSFQPPAPSLFNTDGVVLAEVLVPAGASSVGSSELRDRRLPADLQLDTLGVASTATFANEAADPSSNGEIQRNSADLKVFSGGAVRNLTDAGNAVLTAQVATGTVTLSGGSTPALDTVLSDITSTETETILFVLYVDSDPSFDADYAFNYDYGHVWDDSDSAIDIDVTVNWDTDPGGGNDVTARWEVFA